MYSLTANTRIILVANLKKEENSGPIKAAVPGLCVNTTESDHQVNPCSQPVFQHRGQRRQPAAGPAPSPAVKHGL